MLKTIRIDAMKKLLFATAAVLLLATFSQSAQKTVTVGTSETPASLDTNFGNIQDNFSELYGWVGQEVKATSNPAFNSINLASGNVAANNVQVVKQWITGLSYTADVTAVVHGGMIYVCQTTHTAGTFATDLAASKWKLWGSDIYAPSAVSTVRTTAGGGSTTAPPSEAAVGDALASAGASMVYPGAGIPNSTGSAWGPSYTLDTDLSSVSASDDTVPSAKATKAALDLKSPIDNPTFTTAVTAPSYLSSASDGARYTILPSNTTISPLGDGSEQIYNEGGQIKVVEGDTEYDILNSGDVDDTPVNGETSVPVSSNWAYDHAAATATHGVSGSIVGTSDSATLTNKTLDVEGTGNAITIVDKVWFAAAGCNNATATSFYDLPTSNPAAPACITGTNTQKGVLDFDAATDESAQVSLALPSDWSGNIDLKYKWLADATSGSVVWGVQTSCVADAETDDPSWNTASTVTDAAKGTTLQTNDASMTSITITGCAAGELLHLRFFRDADNGSDDMTGDARLIGAELTLRRAQ